MTAQRLLPLLLLAAGAAHAGAQLRPGGASLLDVPDATRLGAGASLIGLELAAELSRGKRPSYAVSPVGVAFGVGATELSLSMRDGGQPGDSLLPRTRVTAALKLNLLEARGLLPAVAVQGIADRLGAGSSFGGRLLVATDPARALRAAAYAGLEQGKEGEGGLGPSGGLALALRFAADAGVVASASAGPAGPKLATALQWLPAGWFRLSVGWERLPQENVNRITFGFAVGDDGPARSLRPIDVARAAALAERKPPEAPLPPELGEVPQLKLKIRPAGPEAGEKPSVGAAP